MSENKTLLDRWKDADNGGAGHPWLLELVSMVSDQFLVMRAVFGARISYLENQNEIIQTRLAVLEARCQSNR